VLAHKERNPDRIKQYAVQYRQTIRQLVEKARVAKKPGRRADDQTGARLDELAKSRLRWDAIKELVDKETGVHRTVDAYQELLKRYRRRKKPTN